MYMGDRTPEGQVIVAALRKVYGDAFRQFSEQVKLLQSRMNQPTPNERDLEEAKRRVEQARSAYRERRDLLASLMLPQKASGGAASNLDERTEVEQLAHLLWEEMGRPEGKAEEHWYCAESLVHNIH